MSNTESAPTEPTQAELDHVMLNTRSALTKPTLAESVNQHKSVNWYEPVNQYKMQTSSNPLSKSFEHWHAAFGYINSSIFKHQVYYEDGSLLPSALQKYDCEVCSLAKSTHHVPSAATTIRASIPLELIHSDLSGKIVVSSLGS